MDASTIRFNNFLMLFRDFRNAHPELPDRGMLRRFSEYVDLSDRYLSHVRCGRKPIGHTTARHLEQKCGKPVGWMDISHGEFEPTSGDERIMIEQILMLYRASPGRVKRLISDAIRAAITEHGADDDDT